MLGKYSALKNRWEIERTSAHMIETKLWKLLYSQLTKQAKKITLDLITLFTFLRQIQILK